MRQARWALVVAVSLVLPVIATPQSRHSAGSPSVDPGGITIRGTGASSGDSIKLTIARRGNRGPRDVVVNVPPGTRLQSSIRGAQGMVVAGVRGRSLGGNSFTPASEIRASGPAPVTYVLEAYCADFYKANPSPSVTFKMRGQDRVLACILREARGLSVAAKQAAVWIYTDHVTYRQMRAKVPVNQSEWEDAQRVIKRCPQAAGSIKSKKPRARQVKTRKPARRHR